MSIKGKGSAHRSVINRHRLAIDRCSRCRLRRLVFNNPNPRKMVHDGDGMLKKAPEKKEGSGGGMGDDNTGGFGSSYRGIRYNIVVKRKFDSVIEKVD